jgi:hypothetical protein
MYMIPVAGLVAAFALPAVAAPSSPSPSQSNATSGAGTQSKTADQKPTPKIAAKLSQSLTEAGFTDVHVMPESFLVRAKDRDGNPVMMVINPESMTAVTAMDGSSNNALTSSGGNSSSGGATSASPNATTKR